MQCIKTTDSNIGIQTMESRIAGALLSGKKVLWLICGGSNLPAAVRAMELIRKDVPEESIVNLTIGQTDERYGQPGHKDSNWAQMMEMGFNLRKVNSLPILIGKSLDATVAESSDRVKDIFNDIKSSNGIIVAQFGIGTDGHVAGIFPNSVALTDLRMTCGYDAGKFIRLTLTPKAIRMIDVAYTFAFGAPKHAIMQNLRDTNKPIAEMPAQILKEIPESYVYSDQF